MAYESVNLETRKFLWNQLSQYYIKNHLYQDLRLLEISPEFVTVIEKDIRRTQVSFDIKAKAK